MWKYPLGQCAFGDGTHNPIATYPRCLLKGIDGLLGAVPESAIGCAQPVPEGAQAHL